MPWYGFDTETRLLIHLSSTLLNKSKIWFAIPQRFWFANAVDVSSGYNFFFIPTLYDIFITN